MIQFMESFKKPVDVASDKIIIDNSDEILVTSERNPEALPWSKLKIDVVFECTGIFVSKDQAGGHITAGAKKGNHFCTRKRG